MSPRVRKAALAVHLLFTVGWVGAAAAYLALGAAASSSRDATTMRGAWIAMELIGWYVIVPLAMGSVLTGLIMALGTRWGRLRHHWVLISLTLTVFAADVLHPGIGLVALVFVLLLNVYKPRGMTKYGQRKFRRDGLGRPPPDPASRADAWQAGGGGRTSAVWSRHLHAVVVFVSVIILTLLGLGAATAATSNAAHLVVDQHVQVEEWHADTGAPAAALPWR